MTESLKMSKNRDEGEVIASLFQFALGRSVKDNELNDRVKQVADGLSPSQLLWELYNSEEAVNKRRDDLICIPLNEGLNNSFRDKKKFVSAVYKAILCRYPTAGEVDDWLGAMADGMEAATFVKEVHESNEATIIKETQQKEAFNSFFDQYTNVLGRALSGQPFHPPLKVQNVPADERSATGSFISSRRKIEERLNSTSDPNVIDYFRKASAIYLIAQHKVSLTSDEPEEANRRAIAALYIGVFGRSAGAHEISYWEKQFSAGLNLFDLVELLVNSTEGISQRTLSEVCHSYERFIQVVGLLLLGQNYSAYEIASSLNHIRHHNLTPLRYLVDQFGAAARRLLEEPLPPAKTDVLNNLYMVGCNRPTNLSVWFDKERHNHGMTRPRRCVSYKSVDKPGTVTAIASVYKGDQYIENFMENMVGQTIFDQSVTLIIIDAASPQNEADVIERYTKVHSNIIYVRTKSRVGIYDAWNQAIKMTAGDYVTNVNLDDLRRDDSLEIQRNMLDELKFADVAYQDFYYSFDPNLPFKEIERRNIRCILPHITFTNLVHFNSPHNGPMWRRRLHDELGYFNDRYKSAGDCDFWLRCCRAGKIFVKSNEPHVAYYVNPQGLSTHSETLGVIEHSTIKQQFGVNLVHPAFVEDKALFAKRVGVAIEAVGDRPRYDVVTDRMLALVPEALE